MCSLKSQCNLMAYKFCYLFLFLFFLTSHYQADAQHTTDKDSILFYTQNLLDGIAIGDTTAWTKYLDDSCIITSEDGSVKSKQEFIHKIGVPPKYLQVKETISNPLFRSNSNAIVFIYNANLSLRIYGQERLNEICQTDTWFKSEKGWKLISSEALDKPENAIVQKINLNATITITGEYKLSDEYDYKIFIRDGKLFSQLRGKKENELMCETDYTYYIKDKLLIRYIFARDDDDKIIKLILRRAGKDIVLLKVK